MSPFQPAFQLMPHTKREADTGNAGRNDSQLGMTLRRVAVVEDELLVAFALEVMLENLGYEVVGIFPNGEDAIAALDREPVDLVCMDINLGHGIDGIEAGQRILERQTTAILFITAYSDDATMALIREVAPDALILSKPVTEGMLAEAITRMSSSIS